ALNGARSYLRAHNLTATNEALSAALSRCMKAAVPAALADAKAAFDAHMPKIGEATFAASMRLAGIEAAKEAGAPVLGESLR
ncbi:MAG: hypothetical protein Q7R41_20080, partial [Phycisphaerales bacterium]|nr:hypothetical protein [Phycisphaerales bacterium]